MPPREIQRDKDQVLVVLGTLPTPTDVHLEAGDVLYVPRGRVTRLRHAVRVID